MFNGTVTTPQGRLKVAPWTRPWHTPVAARKREKDEEREEGSPAAMVKGSKGAKPQAPVNHGRGL